MIAICPAGPPKLMKPSLSQNQNASEKDTCVGGPAAEPAPIASGAFGVVDIKELDQLAGLVHEVIVIVDQPLRTPQHGLEADRFGYRYPARVEIVDDGADSLERRIALQSEAGEQYLECHLGTDMGELGSVEIVADGALGAILRTLQP